MLDLYGRLLREGWTMRDIDEMDLQFFLHVMSRGTKEKVQKTTPQTRFIDELGLL